MFIFLLFREHSAESIIFIPWTYPISTEKTTYQVPAQSIVVFPNSSDTDFGTAIVGDQKLNILGKTGIRAVRFSDDGTIELYRESDKSGIILVPFYDKLSSCDNYIIANHHDFSASSGTCVYIALTTGSFRINVNSNAFAQMEIYNSNGALKRFAPQYLEYPIQVKISSSSPYFTFSNSIHNLLIKDNSHDSLYSISRSGYSKMNHNSGYTGGTTRDPTPTGKPISPTPTSNQQLYLIIGSVGGTVFVILICICCICCCIKSHKKKKVSPASSSSSSCSSSHHHHKKKAGQSTATPQTPTNVPVPTGQGQYPQQPPFDPEPTPTSPTLANSD